MGRWTPVAVDLSTVRDLLIERAQRAIDRHPTWTGGEFDYVGHYEDVIGRLVAAEKPYEFAAWELPRHMRHLVPGSQPSDRWILEPDDSVRPVNRATDRS